MFTALSEQLTGVLNRLRGRGVLSESDVTDALREIRRHLLEADVSFEVTRGFVERVRERAVGTLQVNAVSPGQQVVKLVHDEIATLLGGTKAGLEFASVGPTEANSRPAFVQIGSTRLNSSHTVISYAVFCLKKKKQKNYDV